VALPAVFLKNEVLWEQSAFIFKGKAAQKRERLLEPEDEDATFFFTRTVNTPPSTQRYIPEDLNPKINRCERLRSLSTIIIIIF
jgi:hypothetical protein